MTSPTFTIVTTCKGRLEYLKHSLPTFVQQPEAEVVVVDYDCPDGTKDWVAAHFPGVKVAVVANEPYFNMSRARNIGARLATAPWLCFCDADQLLAPSFCSMLASGLAPGTYLRTSRNLPSGPQTQPFPLACETATYWAIGGHDDAFRGWAAEDKEFIDRLNRSGKREILLTAELVETLQHSDTERSSFYEHDMDMSSLISLYYARIKQRYFETVGRWFTDEQRYSTYSQVERAVIASIAEPESEATFDIRIDAGTSPWTARLTAQDMRTYFKIRVEEHRTRWAH